MSGTVFTIYNYAPLAQLVEQLTLNQLVEGSSPSWCTKVNYTDSVAQLVEQWPFKPLVVRSSRTGVTSLESPFPHSWGINLLVKREVFSYL